MLIAYLLIAYSFIAEEKPESRFIEVKTKGTGEADWYEVDKTSTIGELKAKIQDKEGILIDTQRLIFGGKRLADNTMIKSLQTDDPETVRIHLTLESIGGGTMQNTIGGNIYIYIYIMY